MKRSEILMLCEDFPLNVYAVGQVRRRWRGSKFFSHLIGDMGHYHKL
jgi:hypothetical protein